LRIIQNKGQAITRRSAGIPSIIQGVLSADPKGPLLIRAMRELKELAAVIPSTQTNGMFLPQVHAMNSLRAVFMSSTLGEPSEKHIPDCLILASKCLTSNIWAIRNCGLMLFRALVDRLLGSSESHSSSDTKQTRLARFSWTQSSEMESVLSQLIDSGTDHSNSSRAIEGVFPALKMIQKIQPSKPNRDYFCRAVLKLCRSSHWHVRDMAARTFCNLAQGDGLIRTINDLLPDQLESQNDLHGRLLCIYYFLMSRIGDKPLPSSEF
jgi:Putative death-receptor fusion protein (DUF2428)/HEAT repeat